MNKKCVSIICIFFLLLSSAVSAQQIKSWYGKLVVPGGELPLAFHIHYEQDSVYTLLESPMQNVKGLPMEKTRISLTEFEVGDAKFGIRYQGVVYSDSIVGVFTQNDLALPMTLYHEYPKEKIVHKRTQTVQLPLPYTLDTVIFTNPKDGVASRGVVTKPQMSVYPMVVLISGSGSQDLNCTVAGHSYFEVIADSLTRAGIAVFRFEDRGIGGSGGDPFKTTTEIIAEDVLAAIKTLRQKDAKISKVGLLGHSQGGNVVSRIASNEKNKIDFAIFMAAPGQIGFEMIGEQVKNIGSLARKSTAETELLWQQTLSIYNKLPKIYDSLKIAKAMQQLAKEQYLILEDSIKKNVKLEDIFLELNSIYNQPATIDLLFFNPIPLAGKIKCPALVLNGDLDIQVQASTNAKFLFEAIKKNNPKTDLKIYPYLNHLFQYAVNGAIEEYEMLEDTIYSSVLVDLVNFIKRQ